MHVKFGEEWRQFKLFKTKNQWRGFAYTVMNILVPITKLDKELINYVNNY
jgi:hypothetical protein